MSTPRWREVPIHHSATRRGSILIASRGCWDETNRRRRSSSGSAVAPRNPPKSVRDSVDSPRSPRATDRVRTVCAADRIHGARMPSRRSCGRFRVLTDRYDLAPVEAVLTAKVVFREHGYRHLEHPHQHPLSRATVRKSRTHGRSAFARGDECRDDAAAIEGDGDSADQPLRQAAADVASMAPRCARRTAKSSGSIRPQRVRAVSRPTHAPHERSTTSPAHLRTPWRSAASRPLRW